MTNSSKTRDRLCINSAGLEPPVSFKPGNNMTQRQVSSQSGNKPSKYRRWCFTLNNYDEEEPWRKVDELAEQKSIKYLVVGREMAPSTGTRHLQGYVEYFNCRSFNGTSRHVHAIFGGNAHIEVAHSSLNENYVYCTKEDKEPFIFKGLKKDAGNKVEHAELGEMAAKQGTEAAKNAFGMDYYVSKNAVDRAANALRSDIALAALKDRYENATLKKWQDVVMKLIELQGDREILFIIDKLGNQGKTWLTQYITLTMNGQCFDSTNKKDVAYALNPEKDIFVFDMTRATEPKMSLQILESLKNGIVFSGKYESGTKIVADAKVVVMANSFTELHEAQLSCDRFMILHLKPEMQEMSYTFTYWSKASEKKVVTGPNGAPGSLKDIVDKMALTEKRWKRKFMKWGATLYKWGYDVHKCLRMRQNGYDGELHRMKRPQDFMETEKSLTQQGVPDPFDSSSDEDEDELNDSYHGDWEKA